MTVESWRVPARVAAVVVTVLAVAGCSAQSGAAAVVEGRTIPIDEVHRATEELAPYLQDASPSSVLMLLVAEPVFDRVARENGVGVSEQEARDVLEQVAAGAEGEDAGPTPEFGPGAVTVARFTLLQQRLQERPDGAELLERVTTELEGLDVEVNPRFGRFDLAGGGITPVQHDWLVPAADAP